MANRSQPEVPQRPVTASRWAELGPALALGPTEMVSLVGGGGKTSAAFALAAHRPGRRIVTTTTKMGSDRTDGLPLLLAPHPTDIDHALSASGAVLIWDSVNEQRALGVAPETCDGWLALADTVVVEADGSRRRPFKAPAPYEPVVPSATTILVACVGLAAVHEPIEQRCHRPELVAAVAGCEPSDRLTPERLVRVLLSADGSRRNCPSSARFAVLLNRCTPDLRPVAAEIGQRLAAADPQVRAVVVNEDAA